MKFKEYEIPDDLLYTKEHEWAHVVDGTVRIGITDYASKTLSDVVYVSLPRVGDTLTQFKVFGTVESIKAVSELYSPFSGVVTKLNDSLNSRPELVNQSPYGEGWLIEVRPSNYESEKKSLHDAKAYSSHLDSLTKK